jgi:putative ABC transport system permease protein
MLREQVRSLDPDLPLFNIRTLDDVLSELLWVNRIFGGMFVLFALMALLIATVGIYGVVSFTTVQRTQEIGIRTALGAPRGHLWWTMMRSRFVQIGIGLGVGSGAALLLLRLMGGMLVGRFGEDPVTLALSAGFLLTVTVIAMVLPIWRATSGNPVAALRYE